MPNHATAEASLGFSPADKVTVPPSTSKPTVAADSLEQTWLDWQCKMVAGIIQGALYRVCERGEIASVAALWPGQEQAPTQLQHAASQALESAQGLLLSQQPSGPGQRSTCDVIVSPLLLQGKPVAVVAVMTSIRSEPQQHAVLQLLQWGGLWFETLLQQQSDHQQEFGASTLELLAAILGHTACRAAATEVVNQLAQQLACERVSIGFRQGLPIRLQALSHVAHFDAHTQLVRNIEAAMEEAVDQASTLRHPRPPSGALLINRAHSELSTQQGHGAICTIPLLTSSAKTVGAITLERPATRPFTDKDATWLASLARIIGPALVLKQREERSIWAKGIEAQRSWCSQLLGPSHIRSKLALLSVTATLLLLAVLKGQHTVTAPAFIEGGVRQLLVASQDGFVERAEVRAGDVVTQGQLIATLDKRNLQLEQRRWQSEHNKIDKEYQEALATRDRIQLSILRAQRDQVEAELRLVEDKITRTRIRAPFDGVVLSGDLSQSLGAPVATGQVLFEVAPLDSYRVVLEVDEHDIAGFGRPLTGQLITAALPQSTFALALEKVVPIATAEDGRNFFRVEAALDQPSMLLRPGMRGVAKVDIGQRSLLWISTHTVIDRLKLWAWSLGL